MLMPPCYDDVYAITQLMIRYDAPRHYAAIRRIRHALIRHILLRLRLLPMPC